MQIVDSERLPKDTAGHGLTSTLRPRNLEEEEEKTQCKQRAKIFRESHGPGQADDQRDWNLAGRVGPTARGIGISQTGFGLGL